MPDNQGKFTLDELLRAKRKERPEPEFWARFEREFKTKQKMLIQRQLVSETRLKSPLSARLFKVGSFTATCGIAAIAVYLGFHTPVSETGLVETDLQQPEAAPAPTFSVAVAEQRVAQPEIQEIGLKEFSTLARPNAPRVVVQETVMASKSPTKTQMAALETLASLEETIRGNRESGPVRTSAFQFVNSNGLFETELAQIDEPAEEVEGVWDLENAFLLGKYADPLTGTLPSKQSGGSIHDIQHVSFSQIDDALSSQVRHSNRSIDALTVRF